MAIPSKSSKPPRKSSIACIACASNDVIEIEMTLADGTEIEFRSCHHCENRWWDRDGQKVELTTVLKAAAPNKR